MPVLCDVACCQRRRRWTAPVLPAQVKLGILCWLASYHSSASSVLFGRLQPAMRLLDHAVFQRVLPAMHHAMLRWVLAATRTHVTGAHSSS